MKTLLLTTLALSSLLTANLAQAQSQTSYCRQQANVIGTFEREVASGNFSVISDLLFQFDCKGITGAAACLEKIRADYVSNCGLN